ncbi:hypothetical protein LCGC14_1317980 [marine sediment metagenome]|uniref:Uncharacterized protein n=1 Tax=marine sediment metagenome TaxID=412755 RepID=A0A0F9N180_9ZZZZ
MGRTAVVGLLPERYGENTSRGGDLWRPQFRGNDEGSIKSRSDSDALAGLPGASHL